MPFIDNGRFALIIGAILTAIVSLALIAGTAATYFGSVADVNNELATADLNDTTAEGIAAIFPLLVGVAAVLGLVSIVLAAVSMRGLGD